MTVQEAFKEFIESTTFINMAKPKDTGAKYRVMRSRFNKGQLDYLAMINLLIEHGYKIEVKRK